MFFNEMKNRVIPIIGPQLSGQITYSSPNHGNYNKMGGFIFMGGNNGKDRRNIADKPKSSFQSSSNVHVLNDGLPK